MTDAIAVEVSGLTKDFGSFRAVDDLTFELPQGDVIGFVGPNGAGKSTTIRMLLGLIRPTAGSGQVFGEPIDNPPAYMDRVGALVESPTLYPQLSGYRNLLVLTRLADLPTARIDEVLDIVKLTHRAQDRYSDYSLGMKQRLGIAAALLQDPDLLILDEPTNGLDPAGTVEMRSLLRGLGEAGTTVMVSSHLLSEIQAACDRLVMIQRGQMVFEGTIDDLLGSRQDRIIAVPEYQTDLGTVMDIAITAGFETTSVDNEVHVVAPLDWAPAFNRLTSGAGVTLRELRANAFDLEEAFLEMTASPEGGAS